MVKIMKKSRYKAFIALESLVVMLILLVLMFYVIHTIKTIVENNSSYAKKQQRFDKLVSIADNMVKSGLAKESSDARYPNWVDENKFASLDAEVYRKQFSLSKLSIAFQQGEGVCIYRLVVFGEQKEIKKLFICGE